MCQKCCVAQNQQIQILEHNVTELKATNSMLDLQISSQCSNYIHDLNKVIQENKNLLVANSDCNKCKSDCEIDTLNAYAKIRQELHDELDKNAKELDRCMYTNAEHSHSTNGLRLQITLADQKIQECNSTLQKAYLTTMNLTAGLNHCRQNVNLEMQICKSNVSQWKTAFENIDNMNRVCTAEHEIMRHNLSHTLQDVDSIKLQNLKCRTELDTVKTNSSKTIDQVKNQIEFLSTSLAKSQQNWTDTNVQLTYLQQKYDELHTLCLQKTRSLHDMSEKRVTDCRHELDIIVQNSVQNVSLCLNQLSDVMQRESLKNVSMDKLTSQLVSAQQKLVETSLQMTECRNELYNVVQNSEKNVSLCLNQLSEVMQKESYKSISIAELTSQLDNVQQQLVETTMQMKSMQKVYAEQNNINRVCIDSFNQSTRELMEAQTKLHAVDSELFIMMTRLKNTEQELYSTQSLYQHLQNTQQIQEQKCEELVKSETIVKHTLSKVDQEMTSCLIVMQNLTMSLESVKKDNSALEKHLHLEKMQLETEHMRSTLCEYKLHTLEQYQNDSAIKLNSVTHENLNLLRNITVLKNNYTALEQKLASCVFSKINLSSEYETKRNYSAALLELSRIQNNVLNVRVHKLETELQLTKNVHNTLDVRNASSSNW
jgi:chromosome segregation ATPase